MKRFLLFCMLFLCATPAQAASRVLVLAWDGADYRSVRQLLDAGRLPNLAKLNVIPLTAAYNTATKAGHSEILTGQGPDITGILSNEQYNSRITPEMTIFYKVRQARPSWFVSIIFSKKRHTGDMIVPDPHSGRLLRQPWLYLGRWARAGNVDSYFNPASAGRRSLRFEETNAKLRDTYAAFASGSADGYFIFCHWCNPDDVGQTDGMGSAAWDESLIALDAMLGEATATMAPDTVFIYSDHGFNDFGSRDHAWAPNSLFASTAPLAGQSIRWDVMPTILGVMGIDTGSYFPPLLGRNTAQ